MSIYKYSVGVIIDEKGNYLYCVAAESGPKENGMGEMSIYAAWRMKKLDTNFNFNKAKKLRDEYIIGVDNKDEGKKYKFILFQNQLLPLKKLELAGIKTKRNYINKL